MNMTGLMGGGVNTTLGDQIRHLPDNMQRLRKSFENGKQDVTERGVASLIQSIKGLKAPQGDHDLGGLYCHEHPPCEFEKRTSGIIHNNNTLSGEFMSTLGLGYDTDNPLFESPGAVTAINKSGVVAQSVFMPTNDLLLGQSREEQSEVSQKYDHNILKRMAFEKATFQLCLSIISGNKEGQELDTTQAQEHIIKILRTPDELKVYFDGTLNQDHPSFHRTTEQQARIDTVLQTQYYRGGYFDGDMAYGVSGCSLNENIVHKILEQNGFPNQKLDEIAKKLKCHTGKADLLASAGDELFARILSSGPQDATKHIKAVAKIILEKAQEQKLEELC